MTELQEQLWRLMSENDRRSIRELQELVHASSTSVITYNLHRLARLGILTPPPHGQARMWRCEKKYQEAANG